MAAEREPLAEEEIMDVCILCQTPLVGDRVWVFSTRPRLLDTNLQTWGPGHDPVHPECAKAVHRDPVSRGG